jgi:hypothetical protein
MIESDLAHFLRPPAKGFLRWNYLATESRLPLGANSRSSASSGAIGDVSVILHRMLAESTYYFSR